MADAPAAWNELLEGLMLLSQHAADEVSPFWCEHDVLHVNANVEQFTEQEIQRLDELGFFVDDEGEGFSSFRFGSA